MTQNLPVVTQMTDFMDKRIFVQTSKVGHLLTNR